MSYILNVPYADKDEAKELGAFWAAAIKKWVIPDHIKDLNRFQKWISVEPYSCIVRKPYLLAISTRECWKCAKEIPVVAPGAVNYYYLNYADEDHPDDNDLIWVKGEDPTLFSDVEHLDQPVLAYLNEHYPFYKYTYSKFIGSSYWANNCKYCGVLQGDNYLHEEPGGSFCPTIYDPVDLKIISFDLEYDPIIRGSYGGSQTEDMDFSVFLK